MKWPLGNSGAAVQTVQYSTVYTMPPPRQPPRKLLDLILIKYLRRPSRSLSTLVLVCFIARANRLFFSHGRDVCGGMDGEKFHNLV